MRRVACHFRQGALANFDARFQGSLTGTVRARAAKMREWLLTKNHDLAVFAAFSHG